MRIFIPFVVLAAITPSGVHAQAVDAPSGANADVCAKATSSALLPVATPPLRNIEWKLDASDGVATLRARIEIESGFPYPEATTLSMELDATKTVLTSAKVTLKGVTTTATAVEEAEAETQFDAFAYSLRAGAARHARRSREPAGAAILAARSRDDGDVRIKLAVPCTAPRSLSVVDLELKSIGTPVSGGVRFQIPIVTNDDTGLSLPTPEVLLLANRGLRGPSEVGPPPANPPRGLRAFSLRSTPAARFVVADASVPNRVFTRGSTHAVESDKGGVTALVADLYLPTPLTQLPGPAHLVFVVDKSVSFGEEHQAAAWALAHGIVARAPPKSVYSVVSFGRFAKIETTRMLDARPLLARSFAAKAENGSALVEALDLATKVASDAAPFESTRIIVISDGRIVPTSPAGTVANRLSRLSAVTHFVNLKAGVKGKNVRADNFSYLRMFDDDNGFAKGAGATGGIFVTAYEAFGSGDYDDPRDTRVNARLSGSVLYRHLVSPQLLEQVGFGRTRSSAKEGLHIGELTPPRHGEEKPEPLYVDPVVAMNGDDARLEKMPESLMAGESIRVLAAVRGVHSPDHFSGLLWADRIEIPVDESASFKKVVPAVVANYAGGGLLSDEEGMALSVMSNAVTPWLSLFGLPTWTPDPVDGRIMIGISGIGGCSCGGSSSHGSSCRGYHPAASHFETDLLAKHLEKLKEKCGTRVRTRARVSFGKKEILQVSLNALIRLDEDDPGPFDDDGLATFREKQECIEEGLWQTSLEELSDTLFDELGYTEVSEFTRRRQFDAPRTITFVAGDTDPHADSPFRPAYTSDAAADAFDAIEQRSAPARKPLSFY